MNFVVLTIFPELMRAFWDIGIMRRAIAGGMVAAEALNIRDYARDRHHTTDDRPYGGGCGMVMTPEPLSAALQDARRRLPDAMAVLLSPQGQPFDQALARELAGRQSMILVCGRYEGIDERVTENAIDLEISIGDFVLTGGEVAAMALMDAVSRLLPGVLGNEDSAEQDSFRHDRLDHAHYTRPPVFEDREVPEVLLSGHHDRIADWRRADALMRTLVKRPDLLQRGALTTDELALLSKWQSEIEALIRSQGGRRSDSLSGDR